MDEEEYATNEMEMEMEEMRAHLIVRKKLSSDDRDGKTLPLLVEGENVTVTISIFNVGNSDARNVKVVDSWSKSKYTLVSGATKGSFDTIAP